MIKGSRQKKSRLKLVRALLLVDNFFGALSCGIFFKFRYSICIISIGGPPGFTIYLHLHFSGSLQVHLPRNCRLRRPVPQQRRRVRVLRAHQFPQQQNAKRNPTKIVQQSFFLSLFFTFLFFLFVSSNKKLLSVNAAGLCLHFYL